MTAEVGYRQLPARRLGADDFVPKAEPAVHASRRLTQPSRVGVLGVIQDRPGAQRAGPRSRAGVPEREDPLRRCDDDGIQFLWDRTAHVRTDQTVRRLDDCSPHE